MSTEKRIWVYADWQAIEGPHLMGFLRASAVRGKETFSFEYTHEWLSGRYAQWLDPSLQLYTGPQYLSSGHVNFGIFNDSVPDRWGRVLMRRREKRIAKAESRPERNLMESDYLLGVHDVQRMGGVRLKLEESGPFLSADDSISAPPWTSLRELEQASLKLEEEDALDQPDYARWIEMLYAPGASLGGARPKAGVIDPSGNLWIAKFPSKQDDHDMAGWEMLVHRLAQQAGLNLPEARVQKFESRYHTFLTKRFDRQGNKRLHFASAMSLLGLTDGANHTEGHSYMDLAELIMQVGSQPKADLQELWRRIAFNVAVSNTDDHLRNHGFMLEPEGWRLSPAYDINAVPYGTSGLSLNIDASDNALDWALVESVAPVFRVSTTQVAEIFSSIRKAVSRWNQVAQDLGISRSEREMMEIAFRYT